jgi:hypothetical protein
VTQETAQYAIAIAPYTLYQSSTSIARGFMPNIPILPNAYEGPPDIDRGHIPADQMPAFLHIMTLLAELGLYERHLLIAVYLYQYSIQAAHEITDFATLEHSLWTTGGWQSMAARDGALTIYHFGRAIEGLKNSLRFCAALNSQVDHRKIKNAGKIFDAAFPDSKAIRDAVAHVADLSQTVEKKTSHAVKGPFKKKWFSSDDPEGITWLPGNMNGHTYAVSFQGKALTYDLSLENAAKLRAVKNQIYSAFEAARKAQ